MLWVEMCIWMIVGLPKLKWVGSIFLLQNYGLWFEANNTWWGEMKQQAAANNRNVTELDNVQQISAGIRLGMTPSGNSIIQSTNQSI